MIEYFWITDTELSVNDKRMTPEEAYKQYPEYAPCKQNILRNQ